MVFNHKPSAIAAGILLSLASATTAFNAQAEAIHPLLDTSTGATAYMFNLSQQVAATGIDMAAGLAGGAASNLEAALKQPSTKPRVVYFPEHTAPRLAMGISPNKTDPVYVCLEGNGYFSKWEIANNGSVVLNNDVLQTVQGRTPCQSWIISALKGKVQPVAQAQIPVKAQVLMPRKQGG